MSWNNFTWLFNSSGKKSRYKCNLEAARKKEKIKEAAYKIKEQERFSNLLLQIFLLFIYLVSYLIFSALLPSHCTHTYIHKEDPKLFQAEIIIPILCFYYACIQSSFSHTHTHTKKSCQKLKLFIIKILLISNLTEFDSI